MTEAMRSCDLFSPFGGSATPVKSSQAVRVWRRYLAYTRNSPFQSVV